MRNLQSSFCFRWYQDVWNSSDETNQKGIEAIHKLVADDVIVHGINDGNQQRGLETFLSFYKEFRAKFSNIMVTVEDVISQDDLEVARFTFMARDRKSGTNVDVTGMGMVRLQNGKIIEAWNNIDFLKMHQQLGFELVQAHA